MSGDIFKIFYPVLHFEELGGNRLKKGKNVFNINRVNRLPRRGRVGTSQLESTHVRKVEINRGNIQGCHVGEKRR